MGQFVNPDNTAFQRALNSKIYVDKTETLLTNEECANAIDMGNFYRVPCDKRDLNYDKYFKDGDVKRNKLTEFNSNNTDLWDVEQVKAKLMELSYVREEMENMKER